MTPRQPGNFIDTLLEEALSRYANVEPPPGMEHRILARLTEKRARKQRFVRGLGVVFVAMLVVVTATTQRFGAPHMAFVENTSPASDMQDRILNVSTMTSLGDALPVVHEGEPHRVRVTKAASARRHSHVEQEQTVRAGLISDLQLDSLELSTLDLSALSSTQ